MIRRFNYTRRKPIRRDQVAIQLVPQARGPAAFNASIHMDDSDLSGDARLYLEAYYKSSYMRFPFGTIGAPRTPENRTLTDIDRGSSVLFRLKVVDESDTHGRILAELDDIVADQSGAGEVERYCILPVRFTELGQEIWRINFESSRPILEVNRFEGVEGFVRSDPLFASLVFPAAVREILTHVIVVLEHDADDDGDDWPSIWIRFAASLHGEVPPDAEEANLQARLDWIDDAVRSFCASQRLRDRLVTARREDRT
jgi:hypothetical protein